MRLEDCTTELCRVLIEHAANQRSVSAFVFAVTVLLVLLIFVIPRRGP